MTFPIIPVTEAMILQDEPMGTKDKYWCALPPEMLGGGKWLLKIPRQEPGKGEHWAEKIACEIARKMELPCAEVALAVYADQHCTLSRQVEADHESLIHGNELIAGRVVGYDPQRKRRTSDHTWERICKAIREVCSGNCEEILGQFAGYLVLDALIANTDRHHENWAVLRNDQDGLTLYQLSPSFDHASSLGREMRDDRRELLLREHRIATYLTHPKSGGGIYLGAQGPIPLPPINLVRELAVAHPTLFKPWLQKTELIDTIWVNELLEQMPAELMTLAQKNFAGEVLAISRQWLLELDVSIQ